MQHSDIFRRALVDDPDLKNFIRRLDATTIKPPGISAHLLWEYDVSKFDWHEMRSVVVQRVIERGGLDDYVFMVSKYGYEGVRNTVRDDIRCFSGESDADFACWLLDLDPTEIMHHRHKLERERFFDEWSGS